MHEADVRVHFGALMVALIKAQMWDAIDDLWDWGEEHLGIFREEFAEELDIDDER
jgi:hypothetical protein